MDNRLIDKKENLCKKEVLSMRKTGEVTTLIGKRVPWKELVKEYPEKWVILDDVCMIGSDVIDGILIGVCTDETKDKIMLENIQNNRIYDYFRTEINGIMMG